jgi:excisionase family DNA binding protein
MSINRIQELEARIATLESMLKPAPTRIEPDVLYTVTHAADFLGCGKTNVYELLLTGEMARTRVGAGKKGLRVRGSDLLLFLDSRREGGPAPRGTFKHLGRYLDN